MYFIRFLCPEFIGAVPAWNTNTCMEYASCVYSGR